MFQFSFGPIKWAVGHSIINSHSRMTSHPGFIVLPNAVSKTLVQGLAAELDVHMENASPTVHREKYDEYHVPPLGPAVTEHFAKVLAG